MSSRRPIAKDSVLWEILGRKDFLAAARSHVRCARAAQSDGKAWMVAFHLACAVEERQIARDAPRPSG